VTTTPAGWYSDPTGTYLYRYWNGGQWTDQVSTGGSQSGVDPTPLDPAVATTPPAPGSAAPIAVAPAPAPAPAQPTIQVTQSRSPVGAVVAGVLAVIAIIAIVAIVANSGDDSDTTPTDPPATEAPDTSAPPEE
jgi:hypothetical protein